MKIRLIIPVVRLSLVALLAFTFLTIPRVSPAPGVGAASRGPVRAQHGMVASTSKIASEVGVDILKRGGNAVDAAIAVPLAEAVTHPAAGNIGGAAS